MGDLYRCCHHFSETRRCPVLGSTFRVGRWWCDDHIPTGDEWCSHSLSVDGWCSYCGGPVPT